MDKVANFSVTMEDLNTSISDEVLSQITIPNSADVTQSTFIHDQDLQDFKEFHVPRRFSDPTTIIERQNAAVKSVSNNTKRKNQWAINVYNAWVTHRNGHNEFNKVPRDFEKLTDEEICETLCKFAMEARNSKGEPYTRDSVFELIMGIQSDLQVKGRNVSFMKDTKYLSLKHTVNNTMKDLSKKGFIRPRNSVEPITEELEEKLWDSGLLGNKDPQTLLNTVVYMFGVHFALCAVQEHKDLKINGQVQFCYDEKLKIRFLRYSEFQSKNHQGGISSLHDKPKVVTAYQNVQNPKHCIVKIFQEYCDRRPNFDKKCSSDLYLRPLHSPKSTIWYLYAPLGINSLSKVISNMMEKLGVTGKFSNHSLHSTLTTRLYAQGLDEQRIHKRSQGTKVWLLGSTNAPTHISILKSVTCCMGTNHKLNHPLKKMKTETIVRPNKNMPFTVEEAEINVVPSEIIVKPVINIRA